MAVAAVQLGVGAQQLALARIRFLTVVRGGVRPTPTEHEVEHVLLSDLEAREDHSLEKILGREDDNFRVAEIRIVCQPLRDFISTLSASERELIHLLFWVGLSQAEVARRRGWHPMKVNRQLQGVLVRARALLAPHKSALLAA